MKLLIVEDDRAQAQLVRDLVQTRADESIDFCGATNLVDALCSLAVGHCDAVLLDLNLPDSSGIETYRRLSRAYPLIPVVVLSGDSDRSIAMQAVREGAQDFLLKGSVDGRTIYRAALYAIERHRREQAERQLLCVQEQERKRVARELHDGVIQTLLSLRLQMQMLGDSTGSEDTVCAAHLRRFADEASLAAEEVRRICRDLHPEVLECRRLHEAVRWYVGKLLSGSSLQWTLDIEPHDELHPAVKQHLFRIFQEATRNVLDHSGATQVHITLRVAGSEVILAVSDNGCGFDVEAAEVRRVGLGLLSLRERTQILRGSLSVESQVGQGTRVEVRAPVEAPLAACRL